jgi:hypothetical protein
MYLAHRAVLGKTLGHWVSSLTAAIEANNNAENTESVVDSTRSTRLDPLLLVANDGIAA